MIGLNSGLIGKTRTTSGAGSTGIWTPNEQNIYEASDTWPVTPVDPYYQYVTLLLHMEGANGSTNFVDNGKFRFPVTPNGAYMDTTKYKYGSSSCYFPATGTISLPTSTAFWLGTADFTLEAWLWFPQVNTFNNYIDLFRLGSFNSYIRASDVSMEFRTPGASVVVYPYPRQQWFHYAASRTSGFIRVFINGVLSASASVPEAFTGETCTLFIGGYDSMWIDEARITQGIGRYTSNFTPPKGPFPNY